MLVVLVPWPMYLVGNGRVSVSVRRVSVSGISVSVIAMANIPGG